MEPIKLGKIELKKPRVYTKEQELADTIFFYFKKQIKFAAIMSFIKTKGYRAIYEIWNEVRQSKPKNEASLFLWRVKNERVIYKNGKQKPKNSDNRK